MIYEYLKSTGAIGIEKLANTETLAGYFATNRRGIRAIVASERKSGRLICSTSTHGGGYFLPANDDEIMKQKKSLEKTFASRADAVRAFRKACKEIEERKAAEHGKEKGKGRP